MSQRRQTSLLSSPSEPADLAATAAISHGEEAHGAAASAKHGHRHRLRATAGRRTPEGQTVLIQQRAEVTSLQEIPIDEERAEPRQRLARAEEAGLESLAQGGDEL